MEITETPPTPDFVSTVDTSRPFSSVKEAVAIFGERLLVGEFYSPPASATKPDYAPPPKRENSWRLTPSPMMKSEDYNDHNDNALLGTLKKLEAELEETKVELKLLKERESETEVALATLNAELHMNMSKLARAEAAAAGKAAKTVRFDFERDNNKDDNGGIVREEEEKKKEMIIRKMKGSQSLAQILSLGEKDHSYILGGKRERKTMKKKKPIIPLVGDLFSRKKGSPTNHNNPLYASPFFYN